MTLPTRSHRGLDFTVLGAGCAQLGNLYRAMSDDEAEQTIRAAWESGIRYFDTAPHYGLGLSERRLGRALAAYPRDEYILSTKVGRVIVPSPETAHERDLADGAGSSRPAAVVHGKLRRPGRSGGRRVGSFPRQAGANRHVVPRRFLAPRLGPAASGAARLRASGS